MPFHSPRQNIFFHCLFSNFCFSILTSRQVYPVVPGGFSGRIVVEQNDYPMIPIKVQCACGQRYSFDVEPLNGRMPYAVACPVCNADGTASANAIIAQTLGASAAAPAAPATTLRAATPSPAPAPAAEAVSRLLTALPTPRASSADKWKWWYFVLAGVLWGGYAIWRAYDRHSIKPLGELFFAVFCILIGIWDFKSKRRKKLQQK